MRRKPGEQLPRIPFIRPKFSRLPMNPLMAVDENDKE
jgi:hypothetical protein